MRQIYQLYYRQNGIRYVNFLLAPPDFKLTKFPKSALFHSYSTDFTMPELDASQPYFQDYQKKILLDYVVDYVNPEGTFRRPVFDLKMRTMGWRRSHVRQFMLEPEAYKTNSNAETLITLNYGYLDVVHKYMPVKMSPYFQWKNRWKTMVAKMKDIAQVSDRQQFVFIPIAPVLAGRTLLEKFTKTGETIQMVEFLGEHGEAGYFQWDIWKWIGVQNRAQSVLGSLETRHLSRINFVFVGASGNQCLVNLGWLNSWIKGQTNQTEFSTITQQSVRYMENVWLKLCLALNGVDFEAEAEIAEVIQTAGGEVSLQSQSTIEETEEVVEEQPDTDESGNEDNSEEVEATPRPLFKPRYLKKEDTGSELIKRLDVEDISQEKAEKIDEALFKEMEADLLALDRLSLKRLDNKVVRVIKKVDPSEPKSDGVEPKTETSVTKEEVLPERPLVEVVDVEEIQTAIRFSKPATQQLKQKIEHHAEVNLLTAAEYRKLLQSVQEYEQSKDPYGSGSVRKEAMVIKEEDVVLSKKDTALQPRLKTPDPSMAESSLKQFDRKYIRAVMKKDILGAIDAIQTTGVVIRKHEVDITHTVLGGYEHHRLDLKPLDGQPSTIQFTLPVVDEEGGFLAGGNRYILRKQRVDLPIRKIAPKIVGLSTYYGKTFVQLNSKVVNDSLAWLCRQINQSAFSPTGEIQELNPGDVFDHEFEAPWLYSGLAAHFDNFKFRDYILNFNRLTREQTVNPKLLEVIEKDGRRWCGWDQEKSPVVIDKNDRFWLVTRKGETDLGTAAEFFGFDVQKQPLDFSEVRIFSKYIPVGIVLAYYLGLSALLAMLKISYREVLPRKNKEMGPDEFAVNFKDVTYVFKKEDRAASLVMAGFTDYEKATKLFDRQLFDSKDVYFNLLASKNLNAIYLRELDMMESAFVDPISKEILESRNEPQTFIGMLFFATQMLTTYTHPASQDPSMMRERGYERFAGFAYKEMVQAIRRFRNRNLSGRSKIDLNPYQVWNSILSDNSIKIAEDINPIQNLKEMEVITYAGQGGRDKDTMTKPTRAFHKNDAGRASESTVDSSAVGTILYLSANPQLKNLRGMGKDKVELTPTSMLSTSALVSPGVLHDAVKRMMFVCTQHSHTIASEAYKQPYLRTGYESVIGQRTSKLFSAAAEEDGEVLSISPRGMIVRYASGEEVGIDLGRQYGRAEGTVYPHDIVTPYKPGESFKAGDILAYNTKFFEPDFIDPKNIVFKTHGVVTTAFMESNKTHEDSSTVSQRISRQFSTEVVKVKSYVVKFGQSISQLVKLGQKVEPKDVLMIIEDEITAGHRQFGESEMETLKRLSNISPRAGVLGTVERYEVYYHGDKRDMTPSLKALADKSDQALAAAAKSTNRPVVTGRVGDDYRVKGNVLEMDHAEIRIYIATKGVTGVGDKLVFGHQMKSTVSEVHVADIRTENGNAVDATFSYRSVAARGVLSPALLGTTITLLDAASKKAADIYLGES